MHPLVTKAIIPTAGYGTRRLPITKVIEKTMLPIGDRPLVDYSIRDIISAGIKELFIVVTDKKNSQIRDYYSENIPLNEYLRTHNKSDKLPLLETLPADVTLHFINQGYADKYGTALPVAAVAREADLHEPVLCLMGDDFIWNPGGAGASETLINAVTPENSESSADSPNSLENPEKTLPNPPETPSAILGVEIPRADVSRYGVIKVSDTGEFRGIVEKPSPATAPSNLINVSKYLLSADLLTEIVKYVENNDFGPADQEYMITDPINTYLAHGGVMRVAKTSGRYLDGGSLAGWLEANRVVYSEPENQPKN